MEAGRKTDSNVRLISWLQVLLIYGSSRLLIFWIGTFATQNIPSISQAARIPYPTTYHFYDNMWKVAFRPERDRTSVFEMWSHWDGEWFIDIAEHGYSAKPLHKQHQNVAMFPLYPLGIRAGNFFYTNSVFWGYLISCLSGAILMLLIYEWAAQETDKATAIRTVTYFCCFPTSFYLSAVYSESLFLLCTVASFYSARNGRWGLAGLFGGFSSLARVTGVFLIVPLGILFWRQYKGHWKEGLYLLQIPLGFSFILISFWNLSGDPLIFLHTQASWERSSSFPWTPLWNFLQEPQIYHFMNSSHDFILTIFTLLLIPSIFKRWPELGIYCLYLVILPLSTGVLMSMSRYLLSCFPLFIILGIWGQSLLWDHLILMSFLIGLSWFSGIFACGYWVG